jgi:hypothetical protein
VPAAFEIDHVFIGTDSPESAIGLLGASGFQFGSPRVHKGQGTFGTFAFLDNAYIELLGMDSESEIGCEVVSPLNLRERIGWRGADACPFGFALRPMAAESLSVPVWDYKAPYLPPGAGFPIVTPKNSAHEPLVFVSINSKPPMDWPEGRRPPLRHRDSRWRLTRAALILPERFSLSEGVLNALGSSGISIHPGPRYHLRLELSGALLGLEKDFSPDIPLTIAW